MNEARLRELLRVVAATASDEIDCDELLGRVARFLGELRSDEPLPADLQAVSQHLQVCPECKEEYDALLQAYDRPPYA